MAPPAYAVATRSSDHRRSVKTQCTPSRGQRPDRLCIGNSYFSFIIGPAPPVAALSSLAWRRIIGVRADLDELRDSSFTARIPTKAAHHMIDTVACKANLLPPPVKPTCSLPLPSTVPQCKWQQHVTDLRYTVCTLPSKMVSLIVSWTDGSKRFLLV
jgi:hypothetical protein